jgi:hypothetical protein
MFKILGSSTKITMVYYSRHITHNDFRSKSTYFKHFRLQLPLSIIIVYFTCTSIYMQTWVPPTSILSGLPNSGHVG